MTDGLVFSPEFETPKRNLRVSERGINPFTPLYICSTMNNAQNFIFQCREKVCDNCAVFYRCGYNIRIEHLSITDGIHFAYHVEKNYSDFIAAEVFDYEYIIKNEYELAGYGKPDNKYYRISVIINDGEIEIRAESLDGAITHIKNISVASQIENLKIKVVTL